MKNMYCSVALLIVFLCIPFSVNACSSSDKINYSKLASNINYRYTYQENGDNVTFNVTFYNIPENFIIVGDNEYGYSGSELTINNLYSGMNRFNIETNLNGCGGISLYTKYVDLPYYNPYYNDPLCVGIENYQLCNKFTTKNLNISYEEFKKKVTEYKKNIIVDDELKTKVVTKGFYDKLVDIYTKYYYIFLPVIIILCVSFIIYRRKRESFFSNI